jgi:hypothetical protein
MAKIVLTEAQLEKMVKRMVSSQIMSEAPVPSGNPGGMTDDEILARAAEIRKARGVKAYNATILKPGQTADDYYQEKDGKIFTGSGGDVTVSATRNTSTRPPLPTVSAPTKLPTTAPVIAQQKTDVASGPTTPAAQAAGAPQTPQQPPLVPAATATAPAAQATTAPKQMSGQEIHNLLTQKGLINGLTDMNGYENRRIVYKGAPLSKEQLGALSTYLVDNGYGGRFSQVPDKRYGQKYVWVKGGNALPSDLEA